jgi:hypothetical protein
MKPMFSNREHYRMFIKGCKLYLKDDDGSCPFEQVIFQNRDRGICFSTPESCLLYCGQIFPEIIGLLENEEDCPCSIAIGDTKVPSIEREDMVTGLIRTRVEVKLKEAYELYRDRYL